MYMYGGIFGYHEPGTYCLEAKIPEASCWKIPAWPRNHCLKNGLSHKSSTFIHHPSQVPSELHPLLRAWLVSSHVTLFLVIYSTRKCTLQKKKSGIAWMPFLGYLFAWLQLVACLQLVAGWLGWRSSSCSLALLKAFSICGNAMFSSVMVRAPR